MIVEEPTEKILKPNLEHNSQDGIFILIKQLFEQHYLDQMFSRIDEFGVVFSELERRSQFYLDLETPTKEEATNLNVDLLSIIEKINHKPEEASFDSKYSDLVRLLGETIKMQSQTVTQEQSRNRFYRQEGEGLFLGLSKFWKRFFYQLSTLPKRFLNVFRKNKREISYWGHDIPFQGLLEYHFKISLLKRFELLSALYSKGISSILISIKSWEEHAINNPLSDPSTKLGFPDYKGSIDNLKESLQNSFDAIFDSSIKEFQKNHEIVGTIELSSKRFSSSQLSAREEKHNQQWSSHHLKWQNTLFAFTEEWRSDLQLFVLANHALQQIADFQGLQEDRVKQNIEPVVEGLRNLIVTGNSEIDSLTDNAVSGLTKINYQLSKKMDGELMPKLNESILGLNIPNLIDRIQDAIEKQVEKYSGSRVIVKDEAFDRPMKSEELKWISSYEIISFELLAELRKAFRITKSSALNSINETFMAFEDLDHIVSFSFNSAITALKEDECTHEEALATAREGLVRIENRLVDLENEIGKIIAKTEEELQNSLQQFSSGLMALSINENLSDLQLRITTAKASRQATQMSLKIFERIQNGVSWILSKSKEKVNNLTSSFNLWRSKYMLVAPNKEASRDVSNFLLEAQQTIEKLPLVYRRLFKIEALKDQEFFVGREKELELISEAYNNWSLGRFAATAVQGEQWSGLTSFVNMVTSKVKFNCQITRISPVQNISKAEELLNLFQTTLEKPELKDLRETEEYLNESPKRVIIIEDLQNLFIRSVDGFALLKSLFEMINNTQKQVFWMVTVNVYAWDYLSKTVQIKDYFSYQVNLKEFGEEQIVDIILKRNRISGFSIRFVADESKLLEKKFNKMDDMQQQEWLRKEFFSSMNSFAKSNVSMALLFWLMSTRDVDQNTITINTFKKPDLSFLATLSAEKVFVLQTLVLHDGLTLSQLADSINISQAQANMLLIALMEDGILNKKKKVFLVNPIVYRAVINLLKSKNLIH